MKKIKIIIFGYGARGRIYSGFALNNPDMYEVVAICEKDEKRRAAAKSVFSCPIYSDYKEMLADKISADVVAVATQDEQHEEHAIACMERGYDLLLEKPISNTREGCIHIYETAKKLNRKVVVCHVLRYTPFYSTIKRIIDAGKLGDVVTIHASENIGYYHYAHSYVRGPWRNKEVSSPIILAKCCHDMDIICYLMGENCESVNSYGELSYYKRENAPKDSSDYCSDCKIENCVYKAQKIYTSPEGKFFAYYYTDTHLGDKVLKDLVHSQYDRCVYKCDNDVCDHQVTIMKFKNGKTACHSMSAFSKKIYRDIKIYGTKAELYGNMEDNIIEIRKFGGEVERVDIDVSDSSKGGHMGGDWFMMNSLYKVLNGEKAEGITYLDVSVESHLISFAAEKSRNSNGETQQIVFE